jgi:hypothetical protein
MRRHRRQASSSPVSPLLPENVLQSLQKDSAEKIALFSVSPMLWILSQDIERADLSDDEYDRSYDLAPRLATAGNERTTVASLGMVWDEDYSISVRWRWYSPYFEGSQALQVAKACLDAGIRNIISYCTRLYDERVEYVLYSEDSSLFPPRDDPLEGKQYHGVYLILLRKFWVLIRLSTALDARYNACFLKAETTRVAYHIDDPLYTRSTSRLEYLDVNRDLPASYQQVAWKCLQRCKNNFLRSKYEADMALVAASLRKQKRGITDLIPLLLPTQIESAKVAGGDVIYGWEELKAIFQKYATEASSPPRYEDEEDGFYHFVDYDTDDDEEKTRVHSSATATVVCAKCGNEVFCGEREG